MSGLLRSNVVVAAGTALSRLSGLLRVFVFAYVVGQNALGDAYFLANETPNIVYDLLLGGVLSATLVPLFTSLQAAVPDGPSSSEREHATNVVVTTAVTLMLALTTLAVLAAPLVFRVYSLEVAPGVDADLFRRVGTTLTRVFLVQILFYGLTGLANAYLNSKKRFAAAAWSPVLPNLVIVVTLLSLPGAGSRRWELADVLTDGRLRWTLGLGATLGIASMALIVVPAARRAGGRVRPAWDWHHPAVRRLLRLSGWTIGFVAANQMAVVVIRNLANGEGEGILTAYVQAFTFFVLPHGLLAVSVSTTFQPELAEAVVARDRPRFNARLTLGVRLITLLTLPAAAVLLVLRRPIAGLMQRGQFDAVAAGNAAEALAGLSIGLAGFSVYLFALRGFYAHNDTRSAFVLNVGENLLNIALAFVLTPRLGVFGLGVSYSVAYLVAAAWALQVLTYKVRGLTMGAITSGMWRPLTAAALMAGGMWVIVRQLADTPSAHAGWRAVFQLGVAGTVGLAVYLAILSALRVPEVAKIGQIARRRR